MSGLVSGLRLPSKYLFINLSHQIKPEKKDLLHKNSVKKLSFKEKQFLEFVIIFPEYLQKFIEAGIEDVIDSSLGNDILMHLKDTADDATGGQERLLDLVEGKERAFISELLITSPSYTDEEKEQTGSVRRRA